MASIAVLTIGDEILAGRITNTNSALISERLRGVGIATVCHLTCLDDLDEIGKSLAFCHERADIVITTGGLGPTEDDLTHEAVARYFGVELELREEELERIAARFAAMGLKMPASNDRSARLPVGGEVVTNNNGTAPGCITRGGRRAVISLPGVPRELAPMLDESVLPFLRGALGLAGVTLTRALKTFGFTESRLGEIISKIQVPSPSFHVGYRPTFPEIHLLLTATAPDEAAALAWLDDYEQHARAAIPRQLFGVDDQELTAVIGDLLRARRAKVATVESCTGGLVGKLFTDVAGSSDYFDRGFVTYTNEAKQQMVGVSPEIFSPGGPGAVSERCALEMARGACAAAGVDYAISTTGVAGPGGGSFEKPVGTVWIGLATPESVTARRYHFPGTREWVRTLTAYIALERLRRHLLGLEESERFSVRGA
jgi:nicotinamide-nucleotide amidase